MHRHLAPFALLASLFLAATGSAATDFRVLVDLDNNPSTGCNVNGMAGVDRVLTTTLDASGSSPRVTSLTRQDCSGSSLGSPVMIDGTGWPATANASTGLNIVETRIPLSAFGSPMPPVMRLGFAMTSGSSTVTVLTDSDGNPILFPGTGKRHAVNGNSRSFIADGNTGDWAGIDPLANGDATQPNTFRIINVFGFVTNEAVFFRFDEQSQASAPTAHNDTYSTPLNTPLSVTGPGILGNDTDPNSKPLTAIQVSSPDRGAVAMNGDGSFTFTPDGGVPSREVFTYQANNGAQSSNVARVEIRVGQTNHPPNAGDDSYNVVRGGTISPAAPGVLQNDNDPDGDALHAVLRTSPTHGTLTLNDDGSFTYVNDGLTTADDQFTYVASDGIDVSREATVHLHVGSNNAPPQAVDDNYSVDEGATLNVAAPGVLTNDHDSDTAPSQLLAVLVTGPLHGTLTLNVNGGFVYTHDGSETTSDSFTYRVSDRQAVSNVATVHITVNPVNDPPTAVNDAYLTLSGTPLVVAASGVLANDTDPDSPASSFSASVATPPANGTLILNANGGFTYTPNAGFFGTDTFTYRTSDGLAQSLPATVTITVDKIPVITSANTVTFTVGVFGTFNVTTSAQPAASIAESGALPAGVTFVDGTGPNKGTGVLSGTPAPGTGGVYNITFTATNPHGSSGPQAFTLIIDQAPAITSANAATFDVGTAGSFTVTTSGFPAPAIARGGVALPSGITFVDNGNGTGTLAGTAGALTGGTYALTFTASNVAGTSPVQNFTLTIRQSPAITSANAATFIIGVPSTFTVTTTGFPRPTVSESGALPNGITLVDNGNGTATLGGTAAAGTGGTYPITMNATNGVGAPAAQPFTITVNCPTITVTNPATTTATAATPFSQTFTQSGGVGAITFTTVSTLPNGLTLAPNGTLSGTPLQTGSFPITVKATDSNGCSGTGSVYTLVVGCQTITVTNPATSTGTISAPFTQLFTQSGAIGTPVFSTASVLPAGLTLNGLGLLSGVPTQTGTFPITVKVTDANGCTGTSPVYNLVINCQTITVTKPATTSGTAASPFSAQFTQTGAIGAATFNTASVLPAGLTLSTAGLLSGTPTQTGTFPIVVTVTDSNGCTGTGATYNLVIGCQTISVTDPATNTGTAASPFSQTFTQTGGIGTTTFSTASTLPAGLTLASNGTLSGTPTQTGSFPIVVVATDSNGCTGTGATYTLVISCQTITVAPPAVGSATINTPFSQNFTQSGAIGTATFTTSSPLPTGLTLAPNGTLSGTPVQGGSFVITVTVTDSNGCTGVSTPYDMFVGCQIITVNNPATTTGTVSAAFSQQFTATNTVGTTTFSTASTLPAGLTLASNGTLSGTPTQIGSFPINVTAVDANGCSGTGPTYTLVIGCQTITVTNPATVPGTVSSPYSVQFTQSGAVGGATFSTASTLPTGLTLSNTGLLSGTPLQNGSFPIVVTVTDGNGCTGSGPTYDLGIGCQTITVNNPATTSSAAGAPLSISFTQSGAVGGATFATASTLPTGLLLATNGTLSGTPTQGGTFPIVVTVTDGNGCTGTSSGYSLTITCPTIAVTNPATTTGTVGAPFSQVFTQTGGQGTVTFSTSSPLPGGLTLASNGTLAGTPSQFGTFPIVVTATDQNGCTGTGSTYTLVISCPTITVNNPGTTTGIANSPFSQPFTQSGAFGAVTFATTSTLPAGLTLSSAGVLSGTPTQTGPFSIVVTVTDAAGCTGTGSTYNLTINCQTITVTNPAVTTGMVNAPFSRQFTQSNAIGTATFTTASTLPSGLSLAADGTLSGTPLQTGTFPIVVTVTDSNGCTGTSSTYNLVIACQVIGITPTSIPGGTIGAPYSVTFTASNFIGSVTWSESGALPTGITFNTATGVLSGTPVQTGTFLITVGATDSNGCSSARGYSLGIVCQTITVTNPSNSTGTVASSFSEQFTQTGALPGATFSTASTLPNGLALNSSTGVLSGTPLQSGTFPIVVTVTDASGCQGSGPTYTLVIACNTITVTNPATDTGTAGIAFSATFTQSGGNGTITWSKTGALPTGISLNASTGVLSGITSQTGSFPITVTATDANGCAGTGATYTLTISCQTISITNPAQTTVQAGTAFSGAFTATGILGTAIWSETGALPTGITLNSATGVLSGTSTQQGSFPISVKVTDTNGCFATSSYTLTVTCPVITVARTGGGSFPAATIGSAYAGQSLTASGGTSPYTFVVSSGTFPPGLALASSGAISGTPTATGTFVFGVTATDVALCTGTQTFSIAVNPAALPDTYGTVNQLVNNTQAVVTGGATAAPSTPFVTLTGTLINNDLPAGGVAANAGTFATSQGGSVTIAADGTFIYTPPVTVNAITSDTFTYTITSNTGGTGTPTSATGTATLTLLGRVWYVKNNGPNGNGQSQSPFNSLVPFKLNTRSTPDKPGDTIFIFTGDGLTTNMTTGVAMLNNESLIGNGVALVMNGNTLVTAGANPQITDTDVTTVDGVHLADGDTVRGLTITGGIGDGIRGVAGPANFTGDTLTITNNTGAGVRLDTTTGVATLTNVTISGNSGPGLGINNGSIAVSVDATSSITSAGSASSVAIIGHATGAVTIAATISDTGSGINIANNTSGTISFTGSQAINGGNINAIAISGNAAAVTMNFSGTLNSTVTTGSAFNATGAGTLNVSGVANLTTTPGGSTALLINGLTVGASGVTFNTVHFASGSPVVNLINVNGLVTIGNGTTSSTITNSSTGITLQGASTSLTLINTTTSGSNPAITNTTNFGTLTLTNDTIGANGDAIVLTAGTLAASGSSINAPNGRGLILNTVTASGTPTFTSVTSGFGTNNIGLTNVTGNLSLGNGSLSQSGGGAAFFISGGNGNVSYGGSITAQSTSKLVDITGHTGGTMTFSGTLGGTSTLPGSGIRIQNSTGTNTYTFSGTQTLGQSAFRMGNTAVTLAGNNATTTFNFSGTMSIFTSGVTAFSATGPTGGTINFNGTNSIDAAGGSALVLNGVNLGNGAFTGVTSTNGVNCIGLTTVTGGTLTISGGALSGSSGSTFLVSGGSPTVIYAGTITQSTALQRVVDVQGDSGGTITFSGAITSNTGSGTGVFLNANTGATIVFTGGMTLSTGNADAFTATGGGTVNVSGVNNITTAAGKGVNWSNDTSSTGVTFNNVTSSSGGAVVIASSGASNFTFNNVTSTTGTAVSITTATGAFSFHQINSNGAAKGISVNALTGGGSFTVTGTGGSGFCDSTHIGGTDCQGGTITGGTTRGAEFINAVNVTLNNMYFNGAATTSVGGGCFDAITNGSNATCNAAIHLGNTTTTALNKVYLNGVGSGEMGLNGNSVSGLTTNGLEIANFTANLKDAAVFQNLTGTCNLSGVNVHNNTLAHNWFITNNTGTANITFTSPIIQNSPLGGIGQGNADGINAQAYNTGTTLNITSNNGTFNNIIGNTTNWAPNSGAHMTAVLNGGTSTSTGGIYMASTGNGTTMTYTISGLTSVTTNATGSNAITVGRLNGTGITETGTISNNTIVTGSSTCSTCSGIVINSYATSGLATISVTGNNVSGNNFNGMNVTGASGGNSLNLTVQGNTFSTTQTPANDGYAIDIQSGPAGGDNDCLFVNLGDMSAAHSVPANRNTIVGANWVGPNTISLASFNSSQLKLQGLTTFTDAGAAAWTAASNVNGGTDAFHLGANQFGGGPVCP